MTQGLGSLLRDPSAFPSSLLVYGTKLIDWQLFPHGKVDSVGLNPRESSPIGPLVHLATKGLATNTLSLVNLHYQNHCKGAESIA